MKKSLSHLFHILIICCFISCSSYNLPDNIKNDFTTNGPLTSDVFQVVIIKAPDPDIKTHTGQRESAYTIARNNIYSECVLQILKYYLDNKKIKESGLDENRLLFLKHEFFEIAENAVIVEEYYLADNSAVLVLRISEKGIAEKILNY